VPITFERKRIQSPSRFSFGLSFLITACGLTIVADTVYGQTPDPLTSAPARTRQFQPGVQIDWARPAVLVEGRVVLRSAPIEFLACFGGKEHESIIRLNGSAAHVYMALGLIGARPGSPPRWDEKSRRYLPATGDLIDVEVEWRGAKRDRRAPAFDWLRGYEFARAPLDRPWVFAGSRPLSDGMLTADRTGEGFAVVDMPNCLVALSRGRPSRNDSLWVGADTSVIPPVGTPVRLVLKPARLRRLGAHIDFRGALFVNERYVSVEDLADLIGLNRQLSPSYNLIIRSGAALRTDVDRIRTRLLEQGTPASAVRFEERTGRMNEPDD